MVHKEEPIFGNSITLIHQLIRRLSAFDRHAPQYFIDFIEFVPVANSACHCDHDHGGGHGLGSLHYFLWH